MPVYATNTTGLVPYLNLYPADARWFAKDDTAVPKLVFVPSAPTAATKVLKMKMKK